MLSSLPILVYHYFGPDRTVQPGIKPEDTAYITPVDLFRTHLQFLKDHGYHPVSLASVAAAFAGSAPLPEQPVVITIDDGHESVISHAAPLLTEYAFPAELFVIPTRVGSPGYAGWDALRSLSAGHIAIQSHALTHRQLTRLNAAEIEHELRESKRLIEAQITAPVVALAVPMGRYPKGLDRQLAACGYKIGCTSTYGLNVGTSSLWALERLMIKSPNDTPAALAQLLDSSSTLAWQMRLRNFAKRLRSAVMG